MFMYSSSRCYFLLLCRHFFEFILLSLCNMKIHILLDIFYILPIHRIISPEKSKYQYCIIKMFLKLQFLANPKSNTFLIVIYQKIPN